MLKIGIQKSVDGRIRRGQAKELLAQGVKYCPSCNRILPVDDFGYISARGGTQQHRCLECMKKYGVDMYEKHRKHRTEKRRTFKAELVAMLGGKCCRCGYDEFLSGLDFHHVDPSKKDNQLAEMLNRHTTRRETAEAEANKCVLLCRNCHSAYHAGEWQAEWEQRLSGFGYTIKCTDAQ